jgi:hypothetical protein
MLISKIRKKTNLIIWLFLGFFLVFGVFITFGTRNMGGVGKDDTTRKRAKIPPIAITVDGRKVSNELFTYRYLMMRQQYEYMGQRFDNYQMDMFLKYQVAQQLIAQELLLEEAEKRNIRADSAEVSKLFEQEEARMVGPAAPMKDPSIQGRVKAFFAEKNRNNQLRDMLSRMGTSYDTFRLALRGDAIQKKVVELLGGDLLVGEKKNALAKANDVVKKLGSNEPFENVARQYSEDEATKANGGDMGWTKRGTLPEPYENTAFKMNVGQVSQPVESTLGYHIIRLLGKKVVGDATFEAEKPIVIAAIKQKKGNPNAKISDDDIKKEYEQIHTEQILIRMKSNENLVSEWVGTERKKPTHKIQIINPELNAFSYMNQSLFDPTAGEPNPDKAIDLYKIAISHDENNFHLYYQIGTLFEQKNAKTKQGRTAEAMKDPYAAAGASATVTPALASGTTPVPAGAKKEKFDENQFLPEALDWYKRARSIALSNFVYDPQVLISEAQLAKKLGNNKLAVDCFADAVDFSAGDMDKLKQIESGLTGYKSKKAKKAIKEVGGLIADLEAIELEKQKDQQGLHTVTVGGEKPSEEAPAAEEGKTGGETKTVNIPIAPPPTPPTPPRASKQPLKSQPAARTKPVAPVAPAPKAATPIPAPANTTPAPAPVTGQ